MNEGAHRLPLAAMVLANLGPVAGVLFLGWDVFLVLVLFWLENVIMGVINVLRMALCSGPWPAKLFMIPFFTVHYGGFAAGHGVFVFGLFGGHENLPDELATFWPWLLDLLVDHHLVLAAGALAVSHLLSFAMNYIGAGEYRTAELSKLMHEPYGRVMVLHVTIIVGGFGAMALGSPAWALLLLIVLKLGLDLRAHRRRHGKLQGAQIPGQPA